MTWHGPAKLQDFLEPLGALRPDPRNARTHDQRNLEAIVASYRRFGQQKPIVVAADGTIVAGNGQYLAARTLGWTHMAVLRTELQGAELIAFALADNQIAVLAGWDPTKLQDLLEELLSEDAALLEAVGFGDDIAAILAPPRPPTGIDDVPAPPDTAVTRPGDLWVLGDHRLLCGDSASAADVDRLLDGQPIHLVNTDPPYNVRVEPRSNNAIAAGLSSFGLTQHQSFDVARQGAKSATTEKLRPKDRPLANDFVSDAEFGRMLRAWFGNIARALEPGRAFYIWGGYANCANYPSALKECSLYFSQAIIWVKEHPVLTRKDFMGNHEWCFYGWREGAAHWFAPLHNVPDVWEVRPASASEQAPAEALGDGLIVEAAGGGMLYLTGRLPKSKARRIALAEGQAAIIHLDGLTDVWRIKKVTPQKMIHLTEKPVELATRAMHYSSRRGEHVLDLFGGSGSTLMAAEVAGRRAYLMELDPPYCDVIVQRWEEYTGKKAQRGA